MSRTKIADCIAVADRIANAADPEFSPDVRPFTLFYLDMTQAYVPAKGWPADMSAGKWQPAMRRESGQKESDRRLWHIEPTSPERVAAIESNERAERLAKMEAFYNPPHGNIEENELEIPDYVTFATGLAEACHRILGEAPAFLLDDDGEADIY